MVLMGETEDGKTVELLVPPEGSKPGDLITFEGQERNPPEGTLNPNKFSKKVAPLLKVNADRAACWNGVPFATDKGICKVKSITNGIVK